MFMLFSQLHEPMCLFKSMFLAVNVHTGHIRGVPLRMGPSVSRVFYVTKGFFYIDHQNVSANVLSISPSQ